MSSQAATLTPDPQLHPAKAAARSTAKGYSMIKFDRLKPSLIVVAAGLALATAPVSLHAQTGNEWIGKRVVQKADRFNLRIGNSVVDIKRRYLTYKVEQVNGPWLWLHAGQFKGWALAAEVVPVEQAIEHFTNAIRANPADCFAYTMRAEIWREEKNELDIALGDYNEALRISPMAASYNNRGNVWQDKKDYDKAIADYSEAIRLDPHSFAAYGHRGTVWDTKKDYDKAIADFNEAIRLDPKYALIYFCRGNVCGRKKDYDKAIADYNEAIRIDPHNALAYAGRGTAWGRKKDYDKAIADYNEAIRIDPQSAYAYDSRASLWATCTDAKHRDGKKAVESATKACALAEWKDANHLDTLAAACAESGDFDSAVKWQTKANELYSDPKDKTKGESWLKLYQDKKPYREIDL
jgi:tetratricopeptide (TPR) repeat protein